MSERRNGHVGVGDQVGQLGECPIVKGGVGVVEVVDDVDGVVAGGAVGGVDGDLEEHHLVEFQAQCRVGHLVAGHRGGEQSSAA